MESTEKFIIFVKGITKELFINNLEFKIKLSKVVPGIKITHLYMNSKGTVCIFLKNRENMLKLKSYWSKVNIPNS